MRIDKEFNKYKFLYLIFIGKVCRKDDCIYSLNLEHRNQWKRIWDSLTDVIPEVRQYSFDDNYTIILSKYGLDFIIDYEDKYWYEKELHNIRLKKLRELIDNVNVTIKSIESITERFLNHTIYVSKLVAFLFRHYPKQITLSDYFITNYKHNFKSVLPINVDTYKIPDVIFSVNNLDIAFEVELTQKSYTKYAQINDLYRTTNVNMIIFLVGNNRQSLYEKLSLLITTKPTLVFYIDEFFENFNRLMPEIIKRTIKIKEGTYVKKTIN